MVNVIICECGMDIKGNSDNHAKSLMKAHVDSKLHKRLMKNKKTR